MRFDSVEFGAFFVVVLVLHRLLPLAALDFAFVDCQQDTPHLRSMGAVTVSRAEYLAMLAEALEQPTLQGSWGPDGPWRA